MAVGLGLALLKGAVFLGVCFLLSRRGLPQLLLAVARTRSRELFTVTVIALCVGVAYGASWLGLSPALGAFAAGLVVSESIYSHRVLADILPFKDLFLTIFFVSVGLLIDVGVVLDNWAWVIGGTVAILRRQVRGGLLCGAAPGRVAARRACWRRRAWPAPGSSRWSCWSGSRSSEPCPRRPSRSCWPQPRSGWAWCPA